jgi:hypothetical protein
LNGIPFFKIGTSLGGNEINSLSSRVVKVVSEISGLSLRELGVESYIPSRPCVYTVHPSLAIRPTALHVIFRIVFLVRGNLHNMGKYVVKDQRTLQYNEFNIHISVRGSKICYIAACENNTQPKRIRKPELPRDHCMYIGV